MTPKSGPMRAMRTLRDANYALLDDLTAQIRYRGHWSAVGRLLLAAAKSGGRLGDATSGQTISGVLPHHGCEASSSDC